jgi:hypothetical protein
MSDHGRKFLVDSLKAEMVGPDPHGSPLDTSKSNSFQSRELALGPWVDSVTGEEILTDRVPPMRRYGVGVLFPEGAKVNEEEPENGLLFEIDEPIQGNAALPDGRGKRASIMDNESGDYDLATANERDPRSAAISFVVDDSARYLSVVISGSYYQPFNVLIGNRRDKNTPLEQTGAIASNASSLDQTEEDVVEEKTFTTRVWHVRRPIVLTAKVDLEDAEGSKKGFTVSPVESNDPHPLTLNIFGYVRKRPDHSQRFVTIALKNDSPKDNCNTHGFFQAEFDVVSSGADGTDLPFPPYPEREDSALLRTDPEARSLALLYRDYRTFAIGHGCTASWTEQQASIVQTISAHFFPTYEAPSITPDIFDENDNSLAVSMNDLAGNGIQVNQFKSLDDLTLAYEAWILKKENEALLLPAIHQEASQRHIQLCRRNLDRMRKGRKLLDDNPNARRAFQLANEAVFKQQTTIPSEARKVTFDKKTKVFRVEPRAAKNISSLGYWRPFQIGFLLSSLCSTIDPDDDDRETVDLIFFPTGGGKTEAYQALIAFSLFYQRITKTDQQVGAIMRYTLRLLTTQQFTRAAGLICCMEIIRKEKKIGGTPFSIGVWVGGTVTPLHRPEALTELRRISGNNFRQDDHKFLLTRCPYCSTDFGRVEGAAGGNRWPAFREEKSPFTNNEKTIVFKCIDQTCSFSDTPLPVWVIDDDIYDQRPSLVIATVDKFAQVAFLPHISKLFGFDSIGVRECDPPSLIIQDELHLISGPLGTMVGLYESIFEDFCIDKRREQLVVPKIVCSTATIRNFQEQTKRLYARDNAVIFPPHGISIEDSFFAKYATKKGTTELEHGRLYIGLLGTSLRSAQDLQVRTMSALLQAPAELSDKERDPWHTLLSFFNRIQDIGTTFTLLQINVSAYLKSVWERKGIPRGGSRRYPRNIEELTSRKKDSELPSAIDALSRDIHNNPIDVCLASNIIEVGVDIPRLSLMTILGQPKTTAQYIQVTGRVGRKWQERPGLVVTMYPPRRPRDRSHFEKFRSYHQRLYAEVEPTSVTPWSTPAMERALHAVIIGYIRNTSHNGLIPLPVPNAKIDEIVELLRERLLKVDPDQLQEFDRIVQKRRTQWTNWRRNVWRGAYDEDSLPLIYSAGSYLPDDKANLAWETPMTMRNVDAECIIRINDIYIQRQNEMDQSI